jgi:hypothetical protein
MKCNHNCHPCRCGAGEGERRKGDALALLADYREAVIRRAQRALLAVLLETGSATADHVRQHVNLPPGIGPKCFGAVPLPLARAGIIRADGYAKTCRPTAHARPLTVWLLADRAAAERWLTTHPDTPDPADADQDAGPQGVLFPLHPTNEPSAAAATAAPGTEY